MIEHGQTGMVIIRNMPIISHVGGAGSKFLDTNAKKHNHSTTLNMCMGLLP